MTSLKDSLELYAATAPNRPLLDNILNRTTTINGQATRIWAPLNEEVWDFFLSPFTRHLYEAQPKYWEAVNEYATSVMNHHTIHELPLSWILDIARPTIRIERLKNNDSERLHPVWHWFDSMDDPAGLTGIPDGVITARFRRLSSVEKERIIRREVMGAPTNNYAESDWILFHLCGLYTMWHCNSESDAYDVFRQIARETERGERILAGQRWKNLLDQFFRSSTANRIRP